MTKDTIIHMIVMYDV